MVNRKMLTATFRTLESYNLNAFGDPVPSSKGVTWMNYVRYRLNVLGAGIDVYASVAYARIRFDHYVETNCIVDKVAGKLVNYK